MDLISCKRGINAAWGIGPISSLRLLFLCKTTEAWISLIWAACHQTPSLEPSVMNFHPCLCRCSAVTSLQHLYLSLIDWCRVKLSIFLLNVFRLHAPSPWNDFPFLYFFFSTGYFRSCRSPWTSRPSGSTCKTFDPVLLLYSMLLTENGILKVWRHVPYRVLKALREPRVQLWVLWNSPHLSDMTC